VNKDYECFELKMLDLGKDANELTLLSTIEFELNKISFFLHSQQIKVNFKLTSD